MWAAVRAVPGPRCLTTWPEVRGFFALPAETNTISAPQPVRRG
jgi:hypothetical protein